MLALRRVPTISQYLSTISVYSLRLKSKKADNDPNNINAELLNFERKSFNQGRGAVKTRSEQQKTRPMQESMANKAKDTANLAQPTDANTRKQRREEEQAAQKQKKSRPQVILDTDSNEVKVLTRQVADSLTPSNAPNERMNIEQELLDVLRGHHVVSKTARRMEKKAPMDTTIPEDNAAPSQESTRTTAEKNIEKTTEAFSSLLRDIKLKPGRTAADSPAEKDPLANVDQTGPSRLIEERETRRPTRDNRRRQEYYKPHRLWSGEALGIFTADDIKQGVEQGSPIWNKFEDDELKRLSSVPPRNAFEEMIQWTNDGILWKFPIDNEQDIGPEADVPFYEHVLLERHLQDFPKSPLIRQFMELVCIGLGRNPYWTAEQKLEHINWFRKFFNEKMEILNETVHTGTLKATPVAAAKPVSTYKPKPPPPPPAPKVVPPAPAAPAASKK